MTHRARRRHRGPRRHKVSKVLLGLTITGATLAIAALSFGIWVLNVAAQANIDELKPIDRGENSVVFAADGSRLGFIQSDVLRTPIDLKSVPKECQDATIAIEDENFYEHDGVDPLAIARAALENIEAGETVQGGSTITQQLVRNLYIADPEQTIERKIIEAQLAQDLEKDRSKAWILEEYLNTASYGTINGRTAVGLEAAAQVFFDKPATELSLDECAMLAGLPQAPSEYNPFTDPDQALSRRNQVLDAMQSQDLISAAAASKARQDGLGLGQGGFERYTEIKEPFFFDYVEAELIERYGVNTVRQGGLEVHTSIDPGLQEVARTAVANQVASLGGPSAALVSIDPNNGRIMAMASSGDYSEQQYNLAAQGNRQPGSAFKPFVLATALEQGIDPDATYYDGSSPSTLDVGGVPWTVANAGDSSSGTMSLTDATTNSVNVIYAKLGIDVGPENFAETADKLGIQSPLDGIPAEAIGGLRVGVSPLEMANAYATFAAGGVHHPATAITRIEFPDGEEEVFEAPQGNRVLSEGIAYEVTRILETVVQSGTGTSASFGCPAAGKTGTTDDHTDAWFVGYTPQYATAVWVGYPEGRISMGTGAYGGVYAAPIWNSYMASASNGFCEDFPQPSELPSLSPFYSGNATTGEGSDNYSTDSDTGYTDTAPTDTATEDTTATDTAGGGEEYDPNLYAPGAGQEPASSPPADPGGGPPVDTPGSGTPGGGTGGTGG